MQIVVLTVQKTALPDTVAWSHTSSLGQAPRLPSRIGATEHVAGRLGGEQAEPAVASPLFSHLGATTLANTLGNAMPASAEGAVVARGRISYQRAKATVYDQGAQAVHARRVSFDLPRDHVSFGHDSTRAASAVDSRLLQPSLNGSEQPKERQSDRINLNYDQLRAVDASPAAILAELEVKGVETAFDTQLTNLFMVARSLKQETDRQLLTATRDVVENVSVEDPPTPPISPVLSPAWPANAARTEEVTEGTTLRRMKRAHGLSETVGPVRAVQLDVRGSTQVGITIAGGIDTNLGALFVAKVLPDSAASKCLCISTGDRIISVQSINADRMTRADVVKLIKTSATDMLELELMHLGTAQWVRLQKEAGISQLRMHDDLTATPPPPSRDFLMQNGAATTAATKPITTIPSRVLGPLLPPDWRVQHQALLKQARRELAVAEQLATAAQARKQSTHHQQHEASLQAITCDHHQHGLLRSSSTSRLPSQAQVEAICRWNEARRLISPADPSSAGMPVGVWRGDSLALSLLPVLPGMPQLHGSDSESVFGANTATPRLLSNTARRSTSVPLFTVPLQLESPRARRQCLLNGENPVSMDTTAYSQTRSSSSPVGLSLNRGATPLVHEEQLPSMPQSPNVQASSTVPGDTPHMITSRPINQTTMQLTHTVPSMLGPAMVPAVSPQNAPHTTAPQRYQAPVPFVHAAPTMLGPATAQCAPTAVLDKVLHITAAKTGHVTESKSFALSHATVMPQPREQIRNLDADEKMDQIINEDHTAAQQATKQCQLTGNQQRHRHQEAVEKQARIENQRYEGERLRLFEEEEQRESAILYEELRKIQRRACVSAADAVEPLSQDSGVRMKEVGGYERRRGSIHEQTTSLRSQFLHDQVNISQCNRSIATHPAPGKMRAVAMDGALADGGLPAALYSTTLCEPASLTHNKEDTSQVPVLPSKESAAVDNGHAVKGRMPKARRLPATPRKGKHVC